MIEFITNNLFIIYIVGFILTYILCKYIRKNSNGWVDVFRTFFLSLFSWLALFFLSLLLMIHLITERLKNKKPPKWL